MDVQRIVGTKVSFSQKPSDADSHPIQAIRSGSPACLAGFRFAGVGVKDDDIVRGIGVSQKLSLLDGWPTSQVKVNKNGSTCCK